LAGLAPDVILAHGAATVASLLQATRTVPIVFPAAGDPVGAGLVDILARSGGNVTGFMSFEYSMGGKWLELLKQIAPSVTRVAVLRDPAQGSGTAEFAAIQAVAPSLRMEVNPVNVRDAGEIERAVTAFARSANGWLIVTGGARAQLHRESIITLAARRKLPAVYTERNFIAAGGWSHMGPIRSTSTGRRPATSTAFSRARSRPTCRCRRLRSTRRWSISRPPRCLASKFRHRCSLAPTR
jgi:putative ABC transport system substrate-binding protein